jgi:hypothetical protein
MSFTRRIKKLHNAHVSFFEASIKVELPHKPGIPQLPLLVGIRKIDLSLLEQKTCENH